MNTDTVIVATGHESNCCEVSYCESNRHESLVLNKGREPTVDTNKAGINKTSTDNTAIKIIKGRGALSNEPGRFAITKVESVPDNRTSDGADPEWELIPRVCTEVRAEKAKSIISRNNSPDLPFSQSINPYQGCEHGCIYCFARPTHAYWDLSPGLDFETRLSYKSNAVELLEEALSKPKYRCQPIALGTNTDPYQPIEKEQQVTRQLLEVLQRHRHPFSIVTKSALILRDLDILEEMARQRLCSVRISVTTLDNDLKRTLEPRTPSPKVRLKTIQELNQAGVPVGVLAAPVIPKINDHELEAILEACRDAGAKTAGYILIRLPHEVKALFEQWLMTHYPGRANHVMSLIRQSRGGKAYNARYGQRMVGSGFYAEMVAQRFRVSCSRLGLIAGEGGKLNCQLFRQPPGPGQLSLF
ncbi:PA0069 family radical SAM protein [Motiliproteus sp. MSK22-1]|uniref:PA0069 family radical SAM protein n=1 Tax=Motiliproteus sp. MSK22-1 TaxID=1897630 RepID=UPI0009F85B98|nr:PA0069 family radical SAM protein [Motiliproteus sp. MSK22-1]